MSRVAGWVATVVMTAVSVSGALIARSAALEPPGNRHVLAEAGRRAIPLETRAGAQRARDVLFAELKPVKLLNCELARFGEPHDGGYLVCANLLGDVGAAYSYGISGYDGWGCEVSTRLKVPVHQVTIASTRRSRPVLAANRSSTPNVSPDRPAPIRTAGCSIRCRVKSPGMATPTST